MFTNNLSIARKVLFKEINDSSINLDHAKTFLVLYGSTIKAKLTEKWESYGVTIGEKDTEITPMSLIDVNQVIRTEEASVMDQATELDDSWIATYLLAIYRMIRAPVSEYKAAICQRITDHLTSLQKNAIAMTEVTEIYLGWINDSSYNAIVAAYDMFFTRFSKHNLSVLKVGTTPSRHRDCSALLSYGYLQGLLGLNKLTDLMNWVFIDQIGDDIDRMYKIGEELEDKNSYFPYQVDMGLVNKSAYSAATNPLFFQWAHTIGALLRAPRSCNARHITDQQMLQILGNAGIVAFVFANVFDYTRVYREDNEVVTTEDNYSDDDDSDDEKSTGALNPMKGVYQSKDPLEWLSLMQSSSGRLPPRVREFIVRRQGMIKTPRVGTIDATLIEIVPNLEFEYVLRLTLLRQTAVPYKSSSTK